MTLVLEPALSSASQKKRKLSYQAPEPLQKAKPRCSPQTKRETAFSFKKSLLSLLLFVGLFYQATNPRGLLTAAQNKTGTCSYGYGTDGLLVSKTNPFGNSSTSGLGVRTSETVDENGINQVSALDVFSRVTQSQDGSGNTLESSYDDAGEVTSRGNQSLTWDSFGRLVSVKPVNGKTWKTVYDGLGRRIQTTCNGSTIHYYYDPNVEFLEIGHDYNGRTWNLYGPDRSGIYGGAQGIGGLEIESTEGSSSGSVVVNNYFGDILGVYSSGAFAAYDATFISYGLAPGSADTQATQDLTPQWRGHYLDLTGFYYMGARYYDPVEGRFISADPLGHGASMSLYDYCNGDPVNGLDPDGRCKTLANNAEVNTSYMFNKARYDSPDFETEMSALKGIPLGFLDLNIFDSPNASSSSSVNYSVNGVNMNDARSKEMSQLVTVGLQVEKVTALLNPSHGIVFDLIRAYGQWKGVTDITSLRAADTFNASGPGNINVVAFSNGTELLAGAMAYISSSVRARMNVQGLGGQAFINQNTYGLNSAVNKRIPSDPVPYLTPINLLLPYQIINGGLFQWTNPLKEHDLNNYAPYITPAL